MKMIYENFDIEGHGFAYYIDDNDEYRFADNSSDVPLTGPIDPETVVWDDNFGWQFNDGTELPWKD